MTFTSLCKSFAIGAAASAVVMLSAGSASAVTFQATYTVDLHTSLSGGTGLAASGINPLNFDLSTSGQMYTVNHLFRITIWDNIDNPDDTISDPISVAFSFTQPSVESGTATGTTTGSYDSVYYNGHTHYYNQELQVVWDAPISVSFDDGSVLQIALLDETINCGTKSCKNGECYGDIAAKFTYTQLQPASPTPLPAALPMFVAGIGLIGGLGYRHKRKARKAAA